MSHETSLDDRQVRANLQRLRREAPQLVRDILARSGQSVMAHANQEGVIPRDTGYLAGSSFVSEPRDGFVELGYTADYAAPVHERHPAKAQWLLRTLNTEGARILLAEARDAFAKMARKLGGAS